MSLNECKKSVMHASFCSRITLNNNNDPIAKYNMLSQYFGSSCINKVNHKSESNKPSSSARKINDTALHNHHKHHHHNHHSHHHHNYHSHHNCDNHWHSKIQTSGKNTWSSITYKEVKPIPDFYPLSISHVIINYASQDVLNTTISKIKECLQKCSIATIYNDRKVMAWCESEDHVRFTIRLFVTPSNDGMDSILVEMQRFHGCAIRFHTYSRFILNYISNEVMKKDENDATTTIEEISIPEIPLQLLPAVTALNNYPIKKITKENKNNLHLNKRKCKYSNDLEVVNNLFSKEDCVDSILLGMESLRFYTDGMNSDYMTKEELLTISTCAHTILLGNEMHPNIHATIKKWLILNNKHKSSSSDDNEIREGVMDDNLKANNDVLDYRNEELLHNHSLAIITNSLSILSNNEQFKSQLYQERSWLHEDLVQILLCEIQNSFENSHHLHDVYLSVKALNALMYLLPFLKQEILDVEGLLRDCLDVGMCNHELLACECQFALNNLDLSV